MPQDIPRTVKKWTVIGHDGLDSLNFTEEDFVSTLGDNKVLVKSKYYDIQCLPRLSPLMCFLVQGASLNVWITATPASAFVNHLLVP